MLLPCAAGCPACYERRKNELSEGVIRGETHVTLEWVVPGEDGSMALAYMDNGYWLGLMRGNTREAPPEIMVRLNAAQLQILRQWASGEGPVRMMQTFMAAQGVLQEQPAKTEPEA